MNRFLTRQEFARAISDAIARVWPIYKPLSPQDHAAFDALPKFQVGAPVLRLMPVKAKEGQ